MFCGADSADKPDMVMNVGALKNGDVDRIEEEIFNQKNHNQEGFEGDY